MAASSAMDNSRKNSSRLFKMFFFISLGLGIDLGFFRTSINTRKLVANCIFTLAVIFNISIAIFGTLELLEITTQNKVLREFYTKDGFGKVTYFISFAWYFITLLQFLTLSFILYLSKYTFYEFVMEMEDIGIDMPKNDATLIYVLAISLVMVVLKIVMSCLEWLQPTIRNFRNWKLFTISVTCHISQVPVDIATFVLFLIYHYTRRVAENANKTFYNSQIDLQKVQMFYISVADCLDKIKPQYNKLLFTELIIDIPKLICVVWSIIGLMKLQAPYTVLLSKSMYVISIVIQIILPAVMVHKSNAAVDSLKIFLHEELLREQVENEPVLRLLRYLEVRPLTKPALRIIPTDMTLIFTLFSLCTTYLIVVVQLTNVI